MPTPPEWTAAPTAAALMLVLLQLQRRFALLPEDPPGGRKAHARPTPMAGVVLGAGAGVLLAAHEQWLLAAATVLATATGHVDDVRKQTGGVRWWQKGLLLLIAAALATAQLHADGSASLLQLALAVLLVATLANAINFLDNTDGVAASIGGVGLVVASGGHGPLAAAGYAFLGFLPLNWPRPRLFLGDAGALPLGLLLGAGALLAAQRGTSPPAWTVVAIAAVPLLDFVQVVVARLWLGFPPWIGDRRHLTFIAMNLGVPRVLVAPALLLVAAGFWATLR